MRKTGYTIIEILFVIVLLAIIAGMALPRVGFEFITKTKVKTTAQKLAADLRHTRSLAITNTRYSYYKLSIDSAVNEYKIYDSSNSQVGQTVFVDPEITISGDKDFIFESLGNASLTSDLSVSLSSKGNGANITVTRATGMVSYE
ncbi:prepilin-type N-terminal cleavage/methylation domain-containing protein [bacterium]|nr:prepilin-type N-terminal cleavage/methylation domain-containing protein [bacterium]